ncbi:MAG: AAA family ATPase [Eubacteriales bacterium]|jgi:cytidylate kinase
MADKHIITIARQYGSGGREIGKKLAEALGYRFYDRALLTRAAEEYGISHSKLEKADERPGDRYLYFNPITSEGLLSEDFLRDPNHISTDDIAQAQFCTIRKIAEEPESAIIIGRCGDRVLRDMPEKLSIYIYADLEDRVRRIMDRVKVNEREAKRLIKRTDKLRASYYNYFTDAVWGDIENYDLCLNAGRLGIEGAVQVIRSYLQQTS